MLSVRRATLIVLLVVVACAGQRAGDTEAPGVGEPAVDGQFTFVVESFECGETEVTSGIFNQTSNGVFCMLGLSVTNTGDRGRRFLAAAQGLLNHDGGRLTPSNEATLLVNADVVNEELNPGLSIDATVVFDVADPDEIEYAHLKDAPLSQGVRVRVGQDRG